MDSTASIIQQAQNQNFSVQGNPSEGGSVLVKIISSTEFPLDATASISVNSANVTLSQNELTFSVGTNFSEISITVPEDIGCADTSAELTLSFHQTNTVEKVALIVQDNDRCLFIAKNPNGAFALGFDGNLGGIPGADAICASEKPAHFPGQNTQYKAFLVGRYQKNGAPVTRGIGGDEWVILPNTKYYKFEENLLEWQLIFDRTDSQGKFPFNTTFKPMYYTATDMWTGLTSTWNTTGSKCSSFVTPGIDWTYGFDSQGGAPQNGNVGLANSPASSGIYYATKGCGSHALISCVLVK
ncbi:hypothetical protein CH373_02835 [Leptospira perolatii]|nr:hypothetical protein CH373_02835 [Leptospira perolatii]